MSSILVIDDDPVLRKYVSSLLSRQHSVEAYESWSAAFQALSENVYDLVMLDVEMPGFQGDAIAGLIRRGKHGKIVLFSSLKREELSRRAKECGADGYVEKSLNPHDLILAVDQYA
ncbi:MAG: response regulator transcription factor [Planctomycetota bacterium]|nr:response regulator transcription factor [Planctomycetota bacterium]